ncbi:hypothetical protein [Massilia niastensis]|uniref:hypothetical protein n=1 Tax=Massilia niastensis TaxID=544911 RepID=UPI000382AED3|nr:hypothetical protein [Massilia niastensis]
MSTTLAEVNVRSLDSSSWQGLVTMFAGLAIIALAGAGIRVPMQSTNRMQR